MSEVDDGTTTFVGGLRWGDRPLNASIPMVRLGITRSGIWFQPRLILRPLLSRVEIPRELIRAAGPEKPIGLGAGMMFTTTTSQRWVFWTLKRVYPEVQARLQELGYPVDTAVPDWSGRPGYFSKRPTS